MPTYEYRCKACGHELEVVQSFTDDSLTSCDECGGALRKVFGNVGIAFKGSGFYKNDSRGKSATTAATADKSSTDTGSDKSGSDNGGTDKGSDAGGSDKGSRDKSSVEAKPAKDNGSSPKKDSTPTAGLSKGDTAKRKPKSGSAATT